LPRRRGNCRGATAPGVGALAVGRNRHGCQG
jgi:hypothetical protein